MNIPAKASYTREDYEKLPEGAPYQLIAGQLIMSPGPSTSHQRISVTLSRVLSTFVVEHKLGTVFHAPSDVRLSEKDIVQPDLYFIKTEREHLIGPQYIEGPPDLLIEILSPSSAYYDLKQKKNLYELHKVPEYWIVDPEDHSVEVYLLEDEHYGITTRYTENHTVSAIQIEDFTIPVKAIFQR